MKKTTLPLVAVAALLAAAPALEAQQSDGAWWRPGVLQITSDAIRYQAAGDDGWWWKNGPTDRRDAPRTDDRAPRTEDRTRSGDGGWWWETDRNDDRRDRDDRDARYDDRDDDRYERRNGKKAKKGKGPPFCRNGQGHPVHGRQWCADKGWTDSRYERRRDDRGSRWERAGWEDVILRGPQPTRDRRMGQASVADILGDVVFGRLAEHGRRSGHRGDVEGRWVPAGSSGSVLQLRMGDRPLAELADVDRDGRVDLVLLSQGR